KFLGQNPEESFEFNQTLELLSQIDAPNTPLLPTQNINVGSASATLPNPNLK
ncbi:EscN/YscN/HrcN family type III secretion system ATPase, partial [Campylobacter jejuni]